MTLLISHQMGRSRKNMKHVTFFRHYKTIWMFTLEHTTHLSFSFLRDNLKTHCVLCTVYTTWMLFYALPKTVKQWTVPWISFLKCDVRRKTVCYIHFICTYFFVALQIMQFNARGLGAMMLKTMILCSFTQNIKPQNNTQERTFQIIVSLFLAAWRWEEVFHTFNVFFVDVLSPFLSSCSTIYSPAITTRRIKRDILVLFHEHHFTTHFCSCLQFYALPNRNGNIP